MNYNHSVWFEQIDEALLKFISETVVLDGVPISSVVRKPEDEFNLKDYPLACIYSNNPKFIPERYVKRKIRVSEVVNNVAKFEDTAKPYELSYQLDFFAVKQSTMNDILRQWSVKVDRHINLPVIDMSGESRTVFVLFKNDWGKNDTLDNGERVYHTFCSFMVRTELDEGQIQELPVVTKPEIIIGGNKVES